MELQFFVRTIKGFQHCSVIAGTVENVVEFSYGGNYFIVWKTFITAASSRPLQKRIMLCTAFTAIIILLLLLTVPKLLFLLKNANSLKAAFNWMTQLFSRWSFCCGIKLWLICKAQWKLSEHSDRPSTRSGSNMIFILAETLVCKHSRHE